MASDASHLVFSGQATGSREGFEAEGHHKVVKAPQESVSQVSPGCMQGCSMSHSHVDLPHTLPNPGSCLIPKLCHSTLSSSFILIASSSRLCLLPCSVFHAHTPNPLHSYHCFFPLLPVSAKLQTGSHAPTPYSHMLVCPLILRRRLGKYS